MSKPTRILIVDRDPVAAEALAQQLAKWDYDTTIASSNIDALQALEKERASVEGCRTGIVIADQDSTSRLGDVGLIRRLHDDWPEVVPIMISAFRKVESAVQAMRFGAADYLLKPIVENELYDAIERALARHYLLAGSEVPDGVAQEAEEADEQEEVALSPSPESDGEAWTPMPLAEAMKEPERRILLAALEANGWNRGQTAAQLDINRTTLYKKIRQYRLDEPA